MGRGGNRPIKSNEPEKTRARCGYRGERGLLRRSMYPIETGPNMPPETFFGGCQESISERPETGPNRRYLSFNLSDFAFRQLATPSISESSATE